MSTPLYILCTTLETRQYLYQSSEKTTIINTLEEFIPEDKHSNKKILLILHTAKLSNTQESIKSILNFNPHALIMIVEKEPKFALGSDYLKLGIKGYANTLMSKEHLLQALNLIDNGNVWLYPEFVTQMISNMSVKEEKKAQNIEALTHLTDSEKNIARLVAKGKTNKEVAIECKITERTVKAHLSSVFKKLDISDRLTLALLLK